MNNKKEGKKERKMSNFSQKLQVSQSAFGPCLISKRCTRWFYLLLTSCPPSRRGLSIFSFPLAFFAVFEYKKRICKAHDQIRTDKQDTLMTTGQIRSLSRGRSRVERKHRISGKMLKAKKTLPG